MNDARTLAGRTLFVTGGSRGIGLAIALRAARDGANIVIAAKTAEPNPRLPGTIHTAARQIEAAGGRALALQVDIRDDQALVAAAEAAVREFGHLDILVNNASAIALTDTSSTSMKRVDLMLDVNLRGTFAATQACLPWLRRSAAAGRNPHVLTLSPPPRLRDEWFAPHVAYTIAKYGMSLCTLGHAREFAADGIAVNSLWPRTLVATAALQMIPGVAAEQGRRPEIVADAAWWILTSDARRQTGGFLIDDEVLAARGVTDLSHYAVVPGNSDFVPDLFVD